jgi:hypothetical protein
MSDVSVEQLLEQIQRHLDARQSTPGSHVAALRHGDRFSETVYDALDEAGLVMDSIHVQPTLTPPHLPLIGGLWQQVREQAHVLVVFYVNRLAGLQGVFNREVVAALSQLVRDLDRGGRANPEDEIGALRAEVAALRMQVEQLTRSTPDSSQQSKSEAVKPS